LYGVITPKSDDGATERPTVTLPQFGAFDFRHTQCPADIEVAPDDGAAAMLRNKSARDSVIFARLGRLLTLDRSTAIERVEMQRSISQPALAHRS